MHLAVTIRQYLLRTCAAHRTSRNCAQQRDSTLAPWFSYDCCFAMPTRTTTYTDDGHLITIHMAKSVSTRDDIERAHHQFIVDHWTSLAAASFQGFKTYGAGAIIVKERSDDAADADHPFPTYQVWFATHLNDWLTAALDTAVAQWLDDQLQTYDPNEAGLYVFFDETLGARPYLVEGTPTPPTAFKASRAAFN